MNGLSKTIITPIKKNKANDVETIALIRWLSCKLWYLATYLFTADVKPRSNRFM